MAPSVAGSSLAKRLKARARCDSACAARAPAVLLLRAHLAEGAVVAVGQEHRVVAEAFVAARRPDQRAVDAAGESLVLAVGHGEGQHARRNARGAAPACRAERLQRVLDLAHGDGEILASARPSAPNRCRARRRAHRPPGRNRRRAQAARKPRAAARALSSAFASKVVAGLLRLRQAELRRRSSPSKPKGASSSSISRTLPALWVATTSGPGASRMRPQSDRELLQVDQPADAVARQRQQRAEAPPR